MKSSWCCQVFWSFFCIEMLLCLCLLSTKYCCFEKLQFTLISFSFKLLSMNSCLAFFQCAESRHIWFVLPNPCIWQFVISQALLHEFPSTFLPQIHPALKALPYWLLDLSVMRGCCSEGTRTLCLLLLSFPSRCLMLVPSHYHWISCYQAAWSI